ncbi:MAG: HAMP domain-containing histidine kinase [Firmicutes bacterium]|nr:HAMP domain-containing histidine kinase [Bacillota bacterium]MBQ7241336.1 HAMP domain-containing histidine kinase [Bacillota bacterium]
MRWLLLILCCIIGFGPIFIFSRATMTSVNNYFTANRQKELMRQANVIADQVSGSDFFTNEDNLEYFSEYLLDTSIQGGYRIMITDRTGMVIMDSNNSEKGKVYAIQEVIEALNNKSVANVQNNGNIYTAVPIMDYTSSEIIGSVLIFSSAADITDTVEVIRGLFSFILLGILICVGIAIFFISKIFVKPLKELQGVINRLTDGHLDSRVKETKVFRNEITDIGSAFNEMADKLEKIDDSRQIFVSNVSHELKTPLSSIKVLADSISTADDLPKEMYIEFLQDITNEVDRMSNIITDLLNLVRLDQKELPLKFEATDLNKFMSDIVKRLTPLANAKDIDITYEGKNVMAEIDSVKLSLAISNLVENAIKYTDEGKVTVTLDSDHQNAFITVADTGIGIPESEQNKIFDRFYRVDKTRDRQTGGTGLGLSITHSTVLMHNGSIKVLSKENEGSTFLVRIPLKHPYVLENDK